MATSDLDSLQFVLKRGSGIAMPRTGDKQNKNSKKKQEMSATQNRQMPEADAKDLERRNVPKARMTPLIRWTLREINEGVIRMGIHPLLNTQEMMI
jgi:hypothetical protein